MKALVTGFLMMLVILFGVIACNKATSQASADDRVGTMDDWGVYRYVDNQYGVVCYAMSQRSPIGCVKL